MFAASYGVEWNNYTQVTTINNIEEHSVTAKNLYRAIKRCV